MWAAPVLARHYVAIPPPVMQAMSLREIWACLRPLMPADERAAIRASHPAVRRL